MLDRRRLFLLPLLAALPRRVQAAEPLKIAFVDTGNTGRSLMAETLARALAARRALPIAVISRGLDVDPFDEAPEANAQTLMAARGFDVANHRARMLTAADIAHADLILTMTTTHVEKVVALYPDAAPKTFTLAAYATGQEVAIPDAWGKPMAAYRAVLDQLDLYLPLALAKAVASRSAALAPGS
jgi:protein-tyrosine phosphatase